MFVVGQTYPYLVFLFALLKIKRKEKKKKTYIALFLDFCCFDTLNTAGPRGTCHACLSLKNFFFFCTRSNMTPLNT